MADATTKEVDDVQHKLDYAILLKDLPLTSTVACAKAKEVGVILKPRKARSDGSTYCAFGSTLPI